jgi:tight adherence protein C
MVILVPLLLGAGLGISVWISVRALMPRPEPIAAVLARLEQPGRPSVSISPTRRLSVVDQAGAAAHRILRSVGSTGPSSATLELAGRTRQRHALDKLIGAIAGLLGPTLAITGLRTVGLRLPGAAPIALSVMCAAAGFLLPDLALRDRAERRRHGFRHALSAYLDLVNILLAGGAGIETALFAAADAGDGWGFTQIRHALDRARNTGQSPWATFAHLGDRLGISELSELAASVSLAGSQGARIRASLAAKADSLRGHQVAQTEAAAEAATERMTIPLAVLLFGFLVLIGYPAIEAVTSAATTP